MKTWEIVLFVIQVVYILWVGWMINKIYKDD